MNPQLSKRTAYLYRSCKQMPLLCVLSLLVPILMPFVLPLCIVYAMQRRRLLSEVESATGTSNESDVEDETRSQLAYLRANGGRFYYPLVAVAVVAVVVASVALMG
jgi:hypothetical protein